MKRIFKTNIELLNTPEYIEFFKTAPRLTYEEAIEKKARYLKGQIPSSRLLSVDELKEMTSDDPVTLTGIFKCEVDLILSEHPGFLDIWEPQDAENIISKAFMNFNTLKNAETYPFDPLCYQLLTTECVRRYFEGVLWLYYNSKTNHPLK